MEPASLLETLETIIRRDPGGRGVSTYRHAGELLAAGHFAAAARDLADTARSVAIVTGFAILTPEGPMAETDGPPGALFLARVFRELGIDVLLLGDELVTPVLRAGCRCWGLPEELVGEIPWEHADPSHPSRQGNDAQHNARVDAWCVDLLSSPVGRSLTHLIAIERAGPSRPPPHDENLCRNMRGESINHYTAKAHRLFERVSELGLPIHTIGIGDGGNEIGLGGVPAEILEKAIARGHAAQIICRIATTWTILAGVSNWGGYALGMAVAALRDASLLPKLPNESQLGELIAALVRESRCVDGVTKRRDATVDGLSLTEELDALRLCREASTGSNPVDIG